MLHSGSLFVKRFYCDKPAEVLHDRRDVASTHMNYRLSYRPVFDPAHIRKELLRILVPGRIVCEKLERRIERLEESFRVYASLYPYGIWAPGLVITNEMRGMTECFLPLSEIRAIFAKFLANSFRITHPHSVPLFVTSVSWLDVLDKLQPLMGQVDPAALLERLMADEDARFSFIFSLFIPKCHGGGFRRYPGQMTFLKDWLAAKRKRFSGTVRCFDAACGTGEGTYDLAMFLLESGIPVNAFELQASTLGHLELFSASHGYFPYDPVRQEKYRRCIEPLIANDAIKRIVFSLEDLTEHHPAEGEGYDIILCNGLLGGPLLHDTKELAFTVGKLSERLKSGGLLLAADRFHGGWKKHVPESVLREMFEQYGLTLLPVKEGIGGSKERN